jgi:inorganic pyrophosphatase
MKVFIENEAGSDQKNIFNESTLEYKKSYTVSARYPFPYGFILNSKSGDGDCLDCFVLTDKLLRRGDIVEVEPVGMFEEIEDGESDHKILAAFKEDLREINQDLEITLRNFSATVFAHLPGKRKEVGRFLGIEDALSLIENSRIKDFN